MAKRRRLKTGQSRSRRSDPAPHRQDQELRGLPDPDPATTQHPHEALPSVPENLRPFAQRGEGRPPLRKAESRRAMADVLDREVRSRSEERRGGRTVRPMPSAWRKGQDMTVPIRTPCRVRGECSIERCERPRHARGWCSHHWRRWHRHGDPLASRCPRYTVDELWRLNAYLGSLAGERTELGDAELLAMSLGRVYGGDLQQTLRAADGAPGGRPPRRDRVARAGMQSQQTA